MTVDVVIESDAWDADALMPLAERAVGAVLSHLGHDASVWEITVLACDDDRIAALNADFRGKPKPTNVLSWPSAERAAKVPGAPPAPPEADVFGDTHLGDIALAHGVCAREAREKGIPMDTHATHLIIHGVLHLLGYDHETDADAALMERIETETLGNLGLPDPYRVNGPVAPQP